MLRVVQRSNAGYRGFDVLLDRRCQRDIHAARIKGRRMSPAEQRRILVIPAGHIDQVHLVIHHLRHPNAVLRCEAIRG